MYSHAIWMVIKEGDTFALYMGLLFYSIQENVSIFILFIIVTGAVMFFIRFVFSKSKITKLPSRKIYWPLLIHIKQFHALSESLVMQCTSNAAFTHVSLNRALDICFINSKIIPISTFINSVARSYTSVENDDQG